MREVQVRMAVGQTGEHRLAAAVDHLGAWLIGHPVREIDGGDSIVFDDQRRVVMDRAPGVAGDDGRVADGGTHGREV